MLESRRSVVGRFVALRERGEDARSLLLGGDNYNRPREYDVHFMLSVQGSAIEAVVEDVSNRSRCAGCTPSGIAYNISTSTVRDHYGDAALFINYPRWSHTSSGFQIMNEWASVPLGPKTTRR